METIDVLQELIINNCDYVHSWSPFVRIILGACFGLGPFALDTAIETTIRGSFWNLTFLEEGDRGPEETSPKSISESSLKRLLSPGPACSNISVDLTQPLGLVESGYRRKTKKLALSPLRESLRTPSFTHFIFQSSLKVDEINFQLKSRKYSPGQTAPAIECCLGL